MMPRACAWPRPRRSGAAGRRDLPLRGQDLEEAAAIRELHREPLGVFLEADARRRRRHAVVVEAHHVRVVERRDRLDLAPDLRGVAAHGVDELDRHVAAQCRVAGAPYPRHAALADRLDELERARA